MRTHRTVAAALLIATLHPLPAVATAECSRLDGPQTVIAASLSPGIGEHRTAVELRLLPGGIAEYLEQGRCTLLGFTGIRDGSAIYTDDGLGRGLTVSVAPDRSLTVSHASGWTAKSR
jgi:hypothetical protein